MYIKVDADGNPEGFPITAENVQYLISIDPSTPILPEMLVELNIKVIEHYNAPPSGDGFDIDSHDVFRGEIVKKENGDIEQVWNVTEISLKEKIRRWVAGPRMSYLLRTDWTQVLDAPLTQEERAAWTEYRAKLRSMTDDIDFNNIHRREDIPWPERPGVLDTVDSKWANTEEDTPQP